MFYVSIAQGNGNVGITDTDDGKTYFLNKKSALALTKLGLNIKGVENNAITPVNYMTDVVLGAEDKVKDIIRMIVDTIPSDALYDLAKENNVANKVKAIDKVHNYNYESSDEEVRSMLTEVLYGDKLRTVAERCSSYASNIRVVDINDKKAMFEALKTNVCMVVQFSKNKSLTAFTATTNKDLVDKLYGTNTILEFSLHNDYLGYIVRMSALRLPDPNKPNKGIQFTDQMQRVYRCELGVTEGGKTKINKEINNYDATINFATVVAFFVLDIDNPDVFKNVKSDIIADMDATVNNMPDIDTLREKYGEKVKGYELTYNKAILELCQRDLASAVNSLSSVDALRQFMNVNGLSSCIDESKIEYAVDQIEKSFSRHLKEKDMGKYLITI